jgi:CheY-like chemotaxis protein
VLPKIFSPFEQGHRAITDESSGLGLGLAICRGVVEAHAGSLGAFSEGPGRGTIMTVELAATDSAPKAAPPPPQLPAPGSSPSLKILLVDDHHDTLRALTRLLKKLSHSVTATDCKATALAAAANAEFDLVISDIGLPDGTGLELMRELSSRSSIPGIAVTGYGTEADIDQTRAAGFIGHLTKPIDFRELEKLLDEAAR